jgi:DNA polymerase III subunit alpha, Gram-positive type
MQERMKRFLNSIGISETECDDLDFDALIKNPFDHKQLDMVIIKDQPWEYPILNKFVNAILHLNYKCSFKFNYRKKPDANDVLDVFSGWYQNKFRIMDNLVSEVHENRLTFIYENEAEKNQYDSVFNEFALFLEFINYELPIEHIIKVNEPEVIADIKKISKLSKKAEKVIELNEDSPFIDNEANHLEELRAAEETLMDEMKQNLLQMEQQRRQQNRYKKGDYVYRDIASLHIKDGNVDFNGEIFSVDKRDIGNNRLFANIGVGAEDHGVFVKAIESKDFTNEKITAINEGAFVRVRGMVDLDKYSKELVVVAHYIDILPPPPLRDDNSVDKRVELHLHTKMSSLDGVGDIDEYCKLAKHMGHKAIAVTDHGVAQAFPEAQKAGKRYGIKIIYGAELNMIDDHMNFIINPCFCSLNESSYVAFDLETTGLSINDDRIIEFGAVKIEHGMITQSMNILINPGPDFTISNKIASLTGIKPSMVAKKPQIKEVLPSILSFIKDSILVTHNAAFDIGFLNEALINHGYPKLVNPVIDTLALSRHYYHDSSSHRLGSLARKVEVNYDEDKAHRAEYDARILAEIWNVLLGKIVNENNILTHEAINELANDGLANRHLFPHHVVVLAKNEQGLKDLFKLISLSHIEYWSDIPRIPRSVLNEHRHHLLVGSACFNGEVFEIAHTRSNEELIQAMKFYDYIELQPLENYSFLINMGNIDNQDHLKRILKRIEMAALDNSKMIVATGDCHYVNPKEKRYRDVYISAKGLKGVNHPLFPYARAQMNKFPNPDQHYRTTEEMVQQFSWIDEKKAYQYVIKNTNKIADLIENINPIKDQLFTPKIENSEEYLREICYQKAQSMYGKNLPDIVKNRLEIELNGINKNRYAVIYYIAHKIIKKANDDGYIVGSRGSVGSSLVATMANITEVNPLPPHYYCLKCQYSEFIEDKFIKSGFDLIDKNCPRCNSPLKHDGQNIPFATFLGFEADKVPDIDLNFPPDYQAIAHEYAKQLLGPENVYRAGTIDTVKDKTAFGYVRGYYERNGINPDSVPRADIAYLASGCRDVKKTTGQHPGGLIVIPEEFDVYDFTPIQYPADRQEGNILTSHFDFHAIHDNVLKLDLLGHVDPQALKMMCDLTGVNVIDIPMNDEDAISLFNSDLALKRKHKLAINETGALGIPEFGTEFVLKMLASTKPKNFGELLIISGLSHGTNVWYGNAEDLINKGITNLAGVIGCRDDIMTYLVDKGIPEKVSFAIMEDVRRGNKVKPEFESILKAADVPAYYIESCNKIKYMFPKAHATAYVMMAIRVAWFKVHYPLEYYATYFSLRAKQYEISTMKKSPSEIYEHIQLFKAKRISKRKKLTPKEADIEHTLMMTLEMVERGYHIENINLYKSDATNFIVDKEKNALIPPFIVIDGIGENAAISIVKAREEAPFISRDDLLSRTKLSITNLNDLSQLKVLEELDGAQQISLFSFDDN